MCDQSRAEPPQTKVQQFQPQELVGTDPISNYDKLRTVKTAVLPFTPHPVWERPQNNYGSNRWVAFSPRLGRQVISYSDLEHDHCVLLEANPLIESFCEQPFRISIRLPSGIVRTIFDSWIKWKCGCEELREIKYQDQLTGSARVTRQLEAQMRWTQLYSFRYSIVTEEVIRADPIRLANWKRILCQLATTHRVDLAKYTDAAVTLMLKSGPLRLSEIESRLLPLDRMWARSAIFKLIHAGRVAAASLDTKPLDGGTLMEVTENGEE